MNEPRENRAAIVANLQNALLLLLRGGAIQGAKERQQFFEDGLQREQREQIYGDITLKLVTMFQEQFQQNLVFFQPFSSRRHRECQCRDSRGDQPTVYLRRD